MDAGASVDAVTESGQTPLAVALGNAVTKEAKRKFQKLFGQFEKANAEAQAAEAKRLKDKEGKKDEL